MDETLLQYGAIGVLALVSMYAARILFNVAQADKAREVARADRLEAELRTLNSLVQNQFLPSALEMVTTTRTLIQLIAELEGKKREL